MSMNQSHVKQSSRSLLPYLILQNSIISENDEYLEAVTNRHIHTQFFSDDIEFSSSNNAKNMEDSFGKALRNSLNEVFIFDANTYKFIDVNKGAIRNIGYSLDELKKLTPLDIKPEFDRDSFIELVTPLLNRTRETVIFTTIHRRKDGTTYPTEIHLQLLSYAEKPAFIAISLDVTEHKQKQEELESMAYYDALTGLPNRALFSDRLQQMISHCKRRDSLFAVCFLDLDDFKPINDNFGHHIGDKLLVEVAKRIQSEIREEDTVSRLGGDEFTLLLGGIKTFQQCKNMLERIHYSLCQPYLIDGHNHHISASTGVSIYPLDDSDSYTLVCHADSAMYQAKSAGKNQFYFYSVLDPDKHQSGGDLIPWLHGRFES